MVYVLLRSLIVGRINLFGLADLRIKVRKSNMGSRNSLWYSIGTIIACGARHGKFLEDQSTVAIYKNVIPNPKDEHEKSMLNGKKDDAIVVMTT